MYVLDIYMLDVYRKSMCAYVHVYVWVCAWGSVGLCIRGNQRRQWHPTPVLLPGKSHGRRSLVGSSSWGR